MSATNYLWNFMNDTIAMEKDDAGNTTAVYTNEPDEFGGLISQRRNGVTSHYHYDGQHSTRMLTDDAQAVTDTYTYTAFGESVATTGSTENPFRYVGEFGYYFDGDSIGYQVRERRYGPYVAVWFSTDPYWLDSRHFYLYVRNRPTRMVDPSGLYVRARGIKSCSELYDRGTDYLWHLFRDRRHEYNNFKKELRDSGIHRKAGRTIQAEKSWNGALHRLDDHRKACDKIRLVLDCFNELAGKWPPDMCEAFAYLESAWNEFCDQNPPQMPAVDPAIDPAPIGGPRDLPDLPPVIPPAIPIGQPKPISVPVRPLPSPPASGGGWFQRLFKCFRCPPIPLLPIIPLPPKEFTADGQPIA